MTGSKTVSPGHATAASLNDLGVLIRDLGDLTSAGTMHERALAIAS